jgi:ectoine hydroxylase-related dioxygenase (phytanoyl-CoA dioxygenase family)
MFGSITAEDAAAFARDGFVIKRGYFAADEVELMRTMIETDPAIQRNVLKIADSEGGATALALWNHPGKDVFGAVARSERVAGGAAALLGGEVYHYHSKLTMKMPGHGGRWEWHQDYGYWYQNGCLFPDMLSVGVAVDPQTKANGCMQMLKGSQLMGRIEHGRVAGQTGADVERVEHAMERLELVHCEMAPGDAVFFHANTLHASAANTSDKPRRLLICCYNAAANNPFKAHHHPQYTPLEILPDAAVREAGLDQADEATRAFLHEDEDATTEARKAS